jgi:hypothetical protein
MEEDMKLKEKKSNMFANSIKLKLIITIIIVQLASSNIGGALNASIYKGIEALGNVELSDYEIY